MTAAALRVSCCRACGARLGPTFCDLGATAVANSYLAAVPAPGAEPRYPLHARVCDRCRLVQLDVTVDAGEVFTDYAYFSSMSRSWVDHARAFARAATERLDLDASSWVIEAASNDGYLLGHFLEAGIACDGIEPAANVAAVARAAGIPTLAEFLTPALARRLVAEHGRTADLVVANNVIAHVPDIRGFAEALAILAGSTGVVSIECPHLLRLIDGVQFDTIYHEHYFYWSLHALEHLLGAAGLQVVDVERLATHGGSLRVFAAASGTASPAVAALRAEESDRGIVSDALYAGFAGKVAASLAGFRSWLSDRRSSGARIAAYGAAAKGNTLLNAAGVTATEIIMAADRAPAKQGKLLPGSHIPVVSPEQMLAENPDVVLILPWNIRPEIAGLLREAGYAGEIWTAIPEMTRWP